VLGDILQTGYTSIRRVQGTVSLSLGAPVPKSDIIWLEKRSDQWRRAVVTPRVDRPDPVGDAVGGGTWIPSGKPEPGYGVSVCRCKCISKDAA